MAFPPSWMMWDCSRLHLHDVRQDHISTGARYWWSSFDHLIRSSQQRLRHGQAECPGGLEVDDQVELRWLLHGQVTGLGALEDLVDVARGAPEEVRQVCSIGHETTGLDKGRQGEDRRQPVLE